MCKSFSTFDETTLFLYKTPTFRVQNQKKRSFPVHLIDQAPPSLRLPPETGYKGRGYLMNILIFLDNFIYILDT
jgi:hypothetical protein